MRLDPNVVASLVLLYQPFAYLRVTPIVHHPTPLGMGFGKTRFASPTDAFKLLYIAEDLETSVAEAIIRDRCEGTAVRELTVGELSGWGVAEVSAHVTLHLLDIKMTDYFLLGVSTDITGAKAQDEARQFSQAVFEQRASRRLLSKQRQGGTFCESREVKSAIDVNSSSRRFASLRSTVSKRWVNQP